jgi:hypothetical protein
MNTSVTLNPDTNFSFQYIEWRTARITAKIHARIIARIHVRIIVKVVEEGSVQMRARARRVRWE